MQKNNQTSTLKPELVVQSKRRALGIGIAAALSTIWFSPVVNSAILPAHAQTGMCVADTTGGGPLAGNARGATTCQAACEAEASSQNASLCAVRETTSGTDCVCDLDLT